ncbi:MAG: hypothetical protein H0V97_09165 [Actinobacteria bacterium]|nr:hypothetical protein [Actinomycetota bacterium]
MAKTLIEQVEEDALDSKRSVADALRKCIALGGRAGSEELRAWASRELQGYDKQEDVPEYRIIAAPIVIDGMTGNALVERQQISTHDLPDVAQNADISETLPLMSGIGELEELARRAREKDEGVMLGLPGGATLAKLMTHEMGDPYRAVQRVYWNASPTAVFGVVDRVRTKLVELVAQIRSDTGSAADPPGDAVQNAVNVVIHEKKSRVTVNTAQSSGSGQATVSPPPEISPPWWRTTKAIWAFVVGAAGIAAAVFAYLQLTG